MKGKKILALTMALLIAGSLAACGKKAPESNTDNNATATAPTTAAVAEEKNVTISVLTQSVEPKELLEKFQSEHKNITVKWEQVDTTNISSVLKTRLAAGGEDLDIITPQKSDIIPMAQAGAFMDMTGKTYLDNYETQAIEASKIDGKNYGIPLTQQAYLVWYNKDIFAQYNLSEPKNWEEFLAVCETLKTNNIAPIALPAKDGWLATVFSGLTYSGLFSEDPQWLQKVKTGEVKWTDEGSIEALNKIKTLLDKEYLLEGSLGTSIDQAYQAFYQGKAAMLVNGAWSMDLIINNTPPFAYGAFAQPGNAKDQPLKVAYTAGNFITIASASKNIDAAETFIDFLSQPENAKLFTDTIKQFSSVKGATADFHEATKVVAPIFENEKSMMMHADVSPSVNSVIASELQKLIAGEATPEEVAQALQTEQDKDVQ